MDRCVIIDFVLLLQRNSISPGEREKYRTRSPAEPDHKKLKKEEKDMGHVSGHIMYLPTLDIEFLFSIKCLKIRYHNNKKCVCNFSGVSRRRR